ncbi:MAG: hypothetical protein Q7R30_15650 [Acidobacteriota bacterium]|nr:hypothetical protein [Acidobacteriota bacterium]
MAALLSLRDWIAPGNAATALKLAPPDGQPAVTVSRTDPVASIGVRLGLIAIASFATCRRGAR